VVYAFLLTHLNNGIIPFLIIGSIIFNLSINKVNKEKSKPYGLNFSFFITGIILHISLEIFGFKYTINTNM
jgi:hypothetical protein